MFLVRKLDAFLNGITTYRLVLYGLMIISAAGLLSSLVGTLPLPIGGMLLSLTLLTIVCWLTNRGLSALWKVTPNDESWLITALILFCMLPPATSLPRVLAIVLAGFVAIAPRYVVAIRGKHALNPAASGAFTIAVLGLTHATWWIGSPVMLPFTLIVGLLVVRKIRRFSMVAVFMSVALIGLVVYAVTHDRSVTTIVSQALLSGPLIFLATIMLTEPSTMPPRFRMQLVYGALVAMVFTLHADWWVFSSSPETALIVGNIFAYAVSPKYRLRLTLVRKTRLSDRVYDFAFKSDRKPAFQPGQYMEWTLPMKEHDLRGNRRMFTIASSPSEAYIHLGVKTYEPSSAYKKTLITMNPGDTMFAGQIAGDFTLPSDPSIKLAFIAGGIGITPFRSMAQHLIDTGQARDCVLYYIVADPAELSYEEVFEQAAAAGVRLVPVLSSNHAPAGWHGKTGLLSEAIIRETAPDYAERTFYLSGPNAMVEHYTQVVKQMGISRSRIRTDHFSGY